MTSEKGEKLQLNVRGKEGEALELGEEYSLPSDPADLKFFSNGKITVSDGDGELERYYYATDGC